MAEGEDKKDEITDGIYIDDIDPNDLVSSNVENLHGRPMTGITGTIVNTVFTISVKKDVDGYSIEHDRKIIMELINKSMQKN